MHDLKVADENINYFRSLLTRFIFPLAFYFVCFYLLTFPLLSKFATHLFADRGDGLQNYWNLWWAHKSIIELNVSPWYTDYLHFPIGTTLLGHTLSLFNGLLGILLRNIFSNIEVYNIVVIFSFVVSGLNTFLLSLYLTRKYYGSLVAGYIFAFSQYHFAHAQGHMNLISTEWIPLFFLSFFLFLEKPTLLKSLSSSLLLFLVFLCDYYYFFYCVLVGFVMVVWHLGKNADRLVLSTKTIILYLVFVASTGLLVAPTIFNFVKVSKTDPFIGAHDVSRGSMDLASVVIPGGRWRFGETTERYWQRFRGDINENSAYLGWSVGLVVSYVFFNRNKFNQKYLPVLFFVLLLFFMFSLGPKLLLYGNEILKFPLPYTLFEIFPFMKLGGMPIRMIVIVLLCASVIFAEGIDYLLSKRGKARAIGFWLLVLLVVEYLPGPLPLTQITVPNYVYVLKDLPSGYGVLDSVSDKAESLYFQTIYDKPMTFGYISRIPVSVAKQDFETLGEVGYANLLEKGIRYVVVHPDSYMSFPCNHIDTDENIRLYDLKWCF